MEQHRHGMTLERLREHLARADGELEAAQRFLDPGTHDEDEVALVKALDRDGSGLGVRESGRHPRPDRHRARLRLDRVRGVFVMTTTVLAAGVLAVIIFGLSTKRRTLEALLKRAGLPDVRLYDLRHTFATLWLESGEHPKILQEILGHS